MGLSENHSHFASKNIYDDLVYDEVKNDFEASMGDIVDILINSSKCQIFDVENGFNINLNKEKKWSYY